MKKLVLILIMFLAISTQANATGAVSSGGAPPLPETPKVAFKYDCRLVLSRVQATSATRFEGSIQAVTTVSWSPSDQKPFNGAMNLTELSWETVPTKSSSQPLQVKVEDQSADLTFEGSAPNFRIKLNVRVTQKSESNKYLLSSHSEKWAPFLKGEVVQVAANVEERANWVDDKPPQNLAMNYTALSADCVRSK